MSSSKRNYNFQDHSTEERGTEAIQDAFITGITSHTIWQYHLENKILDLHMAYTKVITLDLTMQ